jgi:MFS family permease
MKRAVVRGNVLWLSIVSLLNDAASEMIYPLLPLFLTGTLRAGATLLGVIEGVAESASSFVKLFSGWFSDRFGRRKPLVISGYGIAAIARPLIAIVTSPWHVLAIRLSDRVGKGLRTAPRDALLAESVDASMRGRAFGVHRAADHLGAVIGPVLASLLLLVLDGNLRVVFAAALVPGLVAVLVVILRVREHAAHAATPAAAGERSVIGFRGHDPVFPRYLAVVFLFTLGNATDAFLLLRANALGISAAAIPLLWGVHHVSKSAWSVVGGALSDRIGARRAIVMGWLVYAVTYAGFALASEAWQIWPLFIVYGFFYGLTEAPEKALVASLAGAGRKGHAFGAYHFAIGIGALPASILFGFLWQTFNPATAFYAGASLSLLAVFMLIVWVPAHAGRSDT